MYANQGRNKIENIAPNNRFDLTNSRRTVQTLGNI